MCIILTCEKNARPSRTTIETCFNNNPDGAGIMWVEDGMVQTAKGFMDETSLLEAISSIPLDTPLVIHMRIATSGGVDVGTCHPFPVCRDLDALHAASVECHAAVAHNGVIAGVPTDDARGISDTVYFVSHTISDMWRRDNKVTKKMRRRLAKAAPHNRFAIMTENGDVYRIGNGWETVSSGIEASNDSWRYAWRSSWSGLWDSNSYFGKRSVDDELGSYYDLKYDVDRAYAEAINDLCVGCMCKQECMVYGAYCEDVAEIIDAELYGNRSSEDEWWFDGSAESAEWVRWATAPSDNDA